MISTHILDTSIGQPASGVSVRLEKQDGERWGLLGEEKTNSDGRISFNCPPQSGVYRLCFETGAYFKGRNLPAFFPDVPVVFHIVETNRKYHVPLLLNPYGYSTYRGS